MARMWLILLIILGTVLGSVAKTDETKNGATSGDTSAVAIHAHRRRRLETTHDFATQLEMTVCLKDDHTSDSASLSGDEVSIYQSSGLVLPLFFIPRLSRVGPA